MSCASFPPSSNARAKILLTFVVATSLAAVTAAARHWRTTSTPPAAATVPGSLARADIPVVRITIRPTGFDPAELTIPAGRFLLAVDNRSGLEGLTFRLDREEGGRVREARMTRERLAWRAVLDPPPGLYLLTEADHPEWSCRVRVAE